MHVLSSIIIVWLYFYEPQIAYSATGFLFVQNIIAISPTWLSLTVDKTQGREIT